MFDLGCLLLLIVLIVYATNKLKLHPFLTLLFAAILAGFLGGLTTIDLIDSLTAGFGNTLKSIGIVIACGTIIGTFLERSGGAKVVAESVLKLVGSNRAPLAMNLTGFLVSIPVFCDSGFVILSAINKALSKKTGISLAVLAIALASGLYTTHVFVPPTPGPLAAAGTLEADLSRVLLLGLIVALPTAFAGLCWALLYVRKFKLVPQENDDDTVAESTSTDIRCSSISAFAPLLVPIILIALKSIADYPKAPLGNGTLKDGISFIGNPVIALLIGVLIAFRLGKYSSKDITFQWVNEGIKNAGSIILITGAGGAFGSILRATSIGDTFAEAIVGWQLGILLPFVVAAMLKTVQGSSTVAIITTAALMSPMLEPLGLGSENSKALVVLAIGAGSMTVSHLNDSFFWVVSQFSDMDTSTALRCHTWATLVQGLVGISIIGIMHAILG